MNENIEEKEGNKKPKRLTKVSVGIVAVAALGAGMGIYGFIRGQQFGYKRGFINGEIFANDQFRELAKELITLRDIKLESKGN